MFSQHRVGWFHTSQNTPVFLGFQENWQLLILNEFGTIFLPNQACFPAVQHPRHNQRLNISLRPSDRYFPLRSSTSAWHVLRPITSCAVCLPAAAPERWRVNLDSLANMRRGIFWSSLMSVAHQLILLWTPKLKHLLVFWEDRYCFLGSSLLSSWSCSLRFWQRRSRVFIWSVSDKMVPVYCEL